MTERIRLKYEFLKNDFVPLLSKLKPEQKGTWGVLNAQQMVEHFSEAVKAASGKLILPIQNSGERLQKMRDFLETDIPFKENTKNSLMPEEPVAAHHSNMEQSLAELQAELTFFFNFFRQDPEATTANAFFGELNFEQNIQLLEKHARHHLKQFGL